MTEYDPTTGRARRQQAVAEGRRTDAVDRVSGRANPRGDTARSTPRSRQEASAADLASELGIDRSGIGTRDRINGASDLFLRSSGVDEFGSVVANTFADSASFVEAADVAPNVDATTISAAPAVADNRRDDVADRARQESAADTQFIGPADLDADVGALGVRSLGVAPDRQDDVAARAAASIADRSPFVEPGDVDVSVGAQGVTDSGIAADRRDDIAARRFESETALGEVTPEDVTPSGDGFRLTDSAQRELGALKIDSQLPDVDVSASDVTLQDGQAVFEREVTR